VGVDLKQLHDLAKLNGIQVRYLNKLVDKEIESSPQAILGALKALGVFVKDDFSNLTELRQKTIEKKWKLITEPVLVLWEKKKLKILIRLPKDSNGTFEVSKNQKISINTKNLKTKRKITIQGVHYFEKVVEIPFDKFSKLQIGYHKFVLKFGKLQKSGLLIYAPTKSFMPRSMKGKNYSCGVFSPLYSLHSKNSFGIGDFSDLNRFMKWVYSSGCDFVGTLPMLSVFLEKPICRPSPYSPVSRLFWNEMYIDPRNTEEWENCPAAQRLLESNKFINEKSRLIALREVDYEAVQKLKRPILALLAKTFFQIKGH